MSEIMKINRSISLLTSFIFLLAFSSAKAQKFGTWVKESQEGKGIAPSIKLMTRHYGDSVLIQWSPKEATIWFSLLKNGWILERAEVINGMPQEFFPVSKNGIRPWPVDTFPKVIAQDSLGIGIAGQVLYGESMMEPRPASESPMDAIMQQADDDKMRQLTALVAMQQSRIAGYALGLRFMDRRVAKGKAYVYRLWPSKQVGGVRQDTTYAWAEQSKLKINPIYKIESLATDRMVHFKMLKSLLLPNFSAFYVEFSQNEGRAWSRRFSQPFFLNSKKDSIAGNFEVVVDSLPSNYKRYGYRFVAIDIFGDLARTSDPIWVMGRDMTPPSVPLVEPLEQTNNMPGLLLKWQKEFKDADFSHFRVKRAPKYEGPYEILLDNIKFETRSFRDLVPLQNPTAYYIVSAVDTAGNEGESSAVPWFEKDTIPPPVPEGLAGRLNDDGSINLSWTVLDHEDVRGYELAVSNAPSGPWEIYRSFNKEENSFFDSIPQNSINRMLFFRMKAYDWAGNRSDFGAILSVKRKVKTWVQAPSIKAYEVENKVANITWTNSGSPEIKALLAYRRTLNGKWTLIADIPEAQSKKVGVFQFPVPSVSELFALRALDVDSNWSDFSDSLLIEALPENSGKAPRLKLPVAQIQKDSSGYWLTWTTYAESATLYVLIADANNENWEIAGSAPLQLGKLNLPIAALPGKRYCYKLLKDDGTESDVSQAQLIP